MLSGKASRKLYYEELMQFLVLLVAAMHRLHLEHLWVAFWTGRYFKYIPAHEIAASIGPERYISAYVLHWKDTVDDEATAMLEHFTVLLYNMDNIDEVHQQYCQYRIPSQSGACQWNLYHQLYHHAILACHEGSLYWGQAFNVTPALPSPGVWVRQIHQNGNHCRLPFLGPAFSS